jgi:hypothetical protein
VNHCETVPPPLKASTMPAGPVARTRRSYLHFSVRGLLVVVLVIGVWLGWIVRSARIQREAVAAIARNGGWVLYAWQESNGNTISGGEPWAPRWLAGRVGVDYFGHVTVVGLVRSASAPDLALVEVRRLDKLERLSLDNTSVSDAGLVHLKGLSNLSSLWLDGTQVTDAGLVHLKGLTCLSSLWLNSTQVTDAGLVHLKRLTNLSVLWLDGTQVADAGLTHLKGLTKLTDLYIRGTHVTDSGMNDLKRALPGLTIHR